MHPDDVELRYVLDLDPEEQDGVPTTEIHLGDEETLDGILLGMIEKEEKACKRKKSEGGMQGRGKRVKKED